MVHVAQTDIQKGDQEFLREWSRQLGISPNRLLKRIMLAGVQGQLYAENVPDRLNTSEG
jgi:hypothetical protein